MSNITKELVDSIRDDLTASLIRLEKRYQVKLSFIGASADYSETGNYATMKLMIEKED